MQGLALLAALTLGLPVLVLVGRAVLDGALFSSSTLRVVIDALALSLADDDGQPRPDGRRSARRSRCSSRGARSAARRLSRRSIDLPIVLPPSVAGLALLLVFGRRGLLGESLSVLGIEIAFTTIAVVIAQTFVSAPFFIRSARTGFASVDHDLEDAARVDGASERQLFRSITVPLASAALAAGLVMSWARALGEFGATIMFAGSVAGKTQTLPLVVYAEFQGGDLDAAIAAASILVLAAFGVLVAVRILHFGRILDVRAV